MGWMFIASGRYLWFETDPIRIIIVTDPRNA